MTIFLMFAIFYEGGFLLFWQGMVGGGTSDHFCFTVIMKS